ncbi:hypothetical protein [Coleofasciculus sp. FACHB-SPT9]|uniref:hypothetical protein n=1 Tax=Cyanophyceae TaxID=3028117 RepID=UPI001683624A|nr:hypothetical protein [Coleofasciculus sp. FACHB-SPT9]MBD1888996.1 hypothetical protein [Coleofasciculus sp. FACHB-SPT9]
MNLPGISINTFESIEPISVANYLQENGWLEEEKIDTRASIWTKTKNNKKCSVLLPLDTELPDFSSRMYEVFRTLEVVEQRPLSEILSPLKNVSGIAKDKNREILKIKFNFIFEQGKRQFPAKKMGMVLTSLQDLFDAVGQAETGKFSDTGKIQKEIVEKTELSVFETFKGSFGVKLALAPNPEQLEIFESPLAEKVSESFLELIKRSNNSDKEKLKEFLLRLKRRSASRYRKFLMSLISSEADLFIDWGSQNPDKGGQAKLSFDNTVNTVDFINKMEAETPEEYKIIGELLSASKIKNSIEIQSFEDSKKYSAKISEQIANNTEVELTIGKFYSTTIQEITSINPATGEEKIECTIIEILQYNETLENPVVIPNLKKRR